MKRLALLVALAFAGCNFAMWRRLDNAGQNQVLRAASGDRYFLTLATAEGERWTATCDDPDVDVVYICTPAQLHCEMELYALRAGKHVFCEDRRR